MLWKRVSHPSLLTTLWSVPWSSLSARTSFLPNETGLQDALQVCTSVLHLLMGVQSPGLGQS